MAQFGSTGAIATAGSCLVSAGYDLDRGNGFLNGKQQCSVKLSYLEKAYLKTRLIIAVINTTQAVVKLKPEKNSGLNRI